VGFWGFGVLGFWGNNFIIINMKYTRKGRRPRTKKTYRRKKIFRKKRNITNKIRYTK